MSEARRLQERQQHGRCVGAEIVERVKDIALAPSLRRAQSCQQRRRGLFKIIFQRLLQGAEP